MKTRTQRLAWTAAVLAVAVLAWLSQREPVQMASVAQAVRGPMEVSFSEEGKTRLKQRYVVAAPVAGLLRRITLAPGDAVAAGQVVAQIEPGRSALLDPRARSQAQAEASSARSAGQAARARAAAALTAQAVAAQELDRLSRLQAAGMVSQGQLDTVRARAAQARAELDAARADEQISVQRLQAAQASLASDTGNPRSGSRVLDVTSPAAGVVLKRPLDSAVPVPMGQVLLEIGDTAAMEIEVEALSTDAVRLARGQPARITRWGGEGVLQAVVTRVEPSAFTKVSALGVEEQRTRVLLEIQSPRTTWATLGEGYRVEVEFILQQAHDVLQVPASALFRLGEGWAVYRLEHGRARRTPVQLGMRSATAAQVLEGLQAGQTVIVQPDDRIQDGTRIKPGGT
jgi:HlyD family secretion protein